ncbi:MAG: polyprenyl synthetase family protein, partial [Anaerolineae bacterium]|nr:polyprenyl synthetase family protein [Anaerolineae bacterium]
PIERLIESGGKRLRPALVLLYARLSGVARNNALLAAAGVEMLHTATLVHDDLIDNARLRRGVETLNNRWSPTATVLAGDTMFALAAKLIARTENAALVYRFSETLESICAGELRQMLSKNGNLPTVATYYDRIFAKTASLFALCTESGPILGALDHTAVVEARQFGRLLGEAFQIADDVLDIVGTPQRLGKPAGTDLQQGVVTLPVIAYAEAHADDIRLAAVLRHEADAPTITALIDAVRAAKYDEIAMQRAEEHVQEALTILRRHPDSVYRRALEEIARFAIQRRY